jgi:choline dehydrogenase
MQFVRADPHDYDNWQLPQWTFAQMLPYFKKLERPDPQHIPHNEYFRKHQQEQGMMHVTMLDDPNPTNRLFIDACQQHGFRHVSDYNAQESLTDCVAMSQLSTRNSQRWSTASGYLLPIIERPNVDILIHTHTCRIEFDHDKQATGQCTCT